MLKRKLLLGLIGSLENFPSKQIPNYNPFLYIFQRIINFYGMLFVEPTASPYIFE